MDSRIKEAAELLDKEMPGWASKIDVNILSMGSPFRCILGQLYGCYDKSPESIPYMNWAFGGSSRKEHWLPAIEERLNQPVDQLTQINKINSWEEFVAYRDSLDKDITVTLKTSHIRDWIEMWDSRGPISDSNKKIYDTFKTALEVGS